MQIITNLCRFIKYNPNLLHFDLAHTGLNEQMIWHFGNALKRAKSMVALHLSGNPGITDKLKDYLFKRVKCKQREEVVCIQEVE